MNLTGNNLTQTRQNTVSTTGEEYEPDILHVWEYDYTNFVDNDINRQHKDTARQNKGGRNSSVKRTQTKGQSD
jgi:NADH dehydrogenase/NADH:ubiquinone oxidoreductase subunit G